MHRIILIMWIAQAASGNISSISANEIIRTLNDDVESAQSNAETTIQPPNTESGSSVRGNVTRQTLDNATESEPSDDWNISSNEIMQTLDFAAESSERPDVAMRTLNATAGGETSNVARLRTFNTSNGRELRAVLRNYAYHLDGLEKRQKSDKLRFWALKHKVKLLETKTAMLESRIGSHASTVVAFHASWLDGTPTVSAQVLKYLGVSLNIGNAYSNDTGKFTAPRAGIYYFATTNTPGAYETAKIFELVVDSVDLFSLGYNTPYREYYSQSTIQGLVHLNAGQEVWVKASHPGDVYNSEYCTFSGFLLASDI